MDKIISIRLPDTDCARLRRLRGITRRSMSDLVRECVENYAPVLEREYIKLNAKLNRKN
jgi:predicted DNA-binding protein